jgi:spore maturation protein CgeD
MNPRISIFTCSYNKPQYVRDAIDSVLAQTYKDFEYIILENSTDGFTRNIVHEYDDPRIRIVDVDFSDDERRRFYVESHLKNIYSPEAKGELILYLADDDFLEPTCFEEHVKEFDANTEQLINFHGWKITYLGTNKPDDDIGVHRRYGLNTNRRPGRRLDGGAVMFKKPLLADISDPYFKLRWKDAHISDALFLNRLAQLATFYPINKILHTKRITEVSTHGFVDKSGNLDAYRPG